MFNKLNNSLSNIIISYKEWTIISQLIFLNNLPEGLIIIANIKVFRGERQGINCLSYFC